MAFNNEIEKVKAEIKVLEKKLSFLEELEQTKSPMEEGYKKVFGYYPVTDIGDAYWEYFKNGYKQAQKDYKVGEHQEPKKEDRTLYDLIADWWDEIFMNGNPSGQNIESLVDQIELFLPKEQSAEGSQNAYVESAVEGFNDAIKQIKSKLRNKKDT